MPVSGIFSPGSGATTSGCRNEQFTWRSLGALNQDPSFSARAKSILERYASLYRSYPNRDNVLGPTRLFFSTYLESIWLTQLAVAALMLRSDSAPQPLSLAGFDKMVKESASLIGSFDEGWSNRQVWNNTALIGAGLWLGGVLRTNSSCTVWMDRTVFVRS